MPAWANCSVVSALRVEETSGSTIYRGLQGVPRGLVNCAYRKTSIPIIIFVITVNNSSRIGLTSYYDHTKYK